MNFRNHFQKLDYLIDDVLRVLYIKYLQIKQSNGIFFMKCCNPLIACQALMLGKVYYGAGVLSKENRI